jgi:hypothetical protein
MATTDSQATGAGTAHGGRPSGLKNLLDANRTPTIVSARLRAHLHEERLKDDERANNVLHPSEICKDGWCPRAAYYKLVNPPERESISFKQMLIFEHGHSTHRRYQRWLGNGLGMLEGYWKCRRCRTRFYQAGVPTCPGCEGTDCRYDELPLGDPARLIGGRTDGLLFEDRALLEIKTVGEGTVRMASPLLLRACTHEFDGRQVVDLKRVWDGIRRPFAEHVRQATIYTYCVRLQKEHRDIDKIVFLYEWKATNDSKEFVVKYNESLIRPILIRAEEIAAAVNGKGAIPPCRNGENLCVECMKLVVAG